MLLHISVYFSVNRHKNVDKEILAFMSEVGMYEGAQCSVAPNKNTDLVDLNMFKLGKVFSQIMISPAGFWWLSYKAWFGLIEGDCWALVEVCALLRAIF